MHPTLKISLSLHLQLMAGRSHLLTLLIMCKVHLTLYREEKNKLVAQIKELEEKVKSLEEVVKGKDDDLAKKEKMVNDVSIIKKWP